ncbi:MAG: hypothetical protein ACXWV4_03410 [Flavitalea sp.]
MYFILMLLTGISGTTYAQEISASDKLFDPSTNNANRRFFFDLGNGNKVRFELFDIKDLDLFSNMDSVIKVFLKDIEPLKDSLSNEIQSRRIDYLTDEAGRARIRLHLHNQKGSAFVVDQGEISALKLEQDTIHFVGQVPFVADYTLRKPFKASRNYRVSFFLNDVIDIADYSDGSINSKINTLKEKMHTTWVTTEKMGTALLKENKSIYANAPKGYVGAGDYLTFRGSVDIQNYKKYFVPSFSIGAALIFSKNHFKRDVMVSWDPHFFFDRDPLGKFKSFRNDFITLTYGQGKVKDNDSHKDSPFLFTTSLGYLVKREGDYFEKGTFRLGAGRLSLFEGKTKIEPTLYFNNFFKGVTPGLRLIQSF